MPWIAAVAQSTSSGSTDASAPDSAKLASSSGCKLAKAKFSSKDFDDSKAVAKSVSTAFKAAAAGKHEISADLVFFICNETLCERFKEKPQLTFEVNYRASTQGAW